MSADNNFTTSSSWYTPDISAPTNIQMHALQTNSPSHIQSPQLPNLSHYESTNRHSLQPPSTSLHSEYYQQPSHQYDQYGGTSVGWSMYDQPGQLHVDQQYYDFVPDTQPFLPGSIMDDSSHRFSSERYGSHNTQQPAGHRTQLGLPFRASEKSAIAPPCETKDLITYMQREHPEALGWQEAPDELTRATREFMAGSESDDEEDEDIEHAPEHTDVSTEQVIEARTDDFMSNSDFIQQSPITSEPQTMVGSSIEVNEHLPSTQTSHDSAQPAYMPTVAAEVSKVTAISPDGMFLDFQCDTDIVPSPHPATYTETSGKATFTRNYEVGLQTEDVNQTARAGSHKRKSDDDLIDDGHVVKKITTAATWTPPPTTPLSGPTPSTQSVPPGPIPHAQQLASLSSSTSVQQPLPPVPTQIASQALPGKKEAYSALKSILTASLPDYSKVPLTFVSLEDAVEDYKKDLIELEQHFPAAASDSTIPDSDQDRLDAARIIYGAMKDISRAKDAGSKDFKSRWAAKAGKKYEDTKIEATAWEIVELTERLHREGPSVLSIRDRNYLPLIKKSAFLTFEQRIKVIATLCMNWKARNDGLIKGTTIETTVAAPLEALSSAIQNFGHNKDRAAKLVFAKKHENDIDAPKLQVKKRSKKVIVDSQDLSSNGFTGLGSIAAEDDSATSAGNAVADDPSPDADEPLPTTEVEPTEARLQGGTQQGTFEDLQNSTVQAPSGLQYSGLHEDML